MSAARRILHVISGLGAGGAEIALLRLVSELDRTRFQNTVLTLRDGPLRARFADAGIEVIDANLSGFARLPIACRSIAGGARIADPHLIHGWMNHGNVGAWFAWRTLRRRPKLVWGIRQSLYDFQHEKLATRLVIRAEAALSAAPNVILFNSGIAISQHRAHGFNNPRMEFIPNGFDTRKFRADAASRSDTRIQLGVPEDAILVGLVARYHPIKDFPMFFSAMARVLAARPDIWALAIGTGVPKLASDVQQIVGRELAARILLRDECAQVERIYPALDVCCSTSCGEGFPNVVAEAMACEVPCVVTDAGDSAAVVGDAGRVVPRGNAVACAEAVLAIVANGAARMELGRLARDRIVAHYSIATTAASYSRLYDTLLEQDEST